MEEEMEGGGGEKERMRRKDNVRRKLTGKLLTLDKLSH